MTIEIKTLYWAVFAILYLVCLICIGKSMNKASGIGAGIGEMFVFMAVTVLYLSTWLLWFIVW